MDTVTLLDILKWLGDHVVQIAVFIGVFVEITPIKFNPITFILKLLYKPLRKDMDDMKTELNNNINTVKAELKEEINQLKDQQIQQQENTIALIKTLEMDEISRIRWEIIQFSRSIDNKQLHTRDEYRHIFDNNKRYHALIAKYELTNGLIDDEMDNITKHYDSHKESNEFYF